MRFLGTVFYWYLWYSFGIWMGYFYRFNRKKHITGIEKIPTERPVIFCSNHPNAFMDAIMVGSALPRRNWFLARSDVFRKKALAKFLGFVGIIPIYRALEGTENLAKNDETFDKCTSMLEENKCILIFSEGLCIQERRLRKLKKGTARIAFGAEEKNNFNLNLTIVPVGINYEASAWKFRSRVYIECGEPFSMKDYEQLYRQDKAKAMNQFTRDLEKKMAERLVIIEDKENDELVDGLEEILRDEWTEAAGMNPENQNDTHKISKEIASVVNAATIAHPEKISDLKQQVDIYREGLKEIGVRDWLMRPKGVESIGGSGLLMDFLYFVLLFPLWIFGMITNYVPYKVPYALAQKIVKHMEWHASISGTVGTFLWQIWYGLTSLAVALVSRNWYILGAYMIAMPICGYIAQEYWARMKKAKGKSALLSAFRSDKSKVEKLVALRADIVAEMNALRVR
jgi:glycerol-3-phosphate O-acyltransferase/dihydroxyacetone phosphate acyltransferase